MAGKLRSFYQPSNSVHMLMSVIAILGTLSLDLAQAQEAQWIWSPQHPRGAAVAGDCFFRKSLQLGAIEQATVTITADDSYRLYVNGREIGAGRSIRQMEQYDITRLLSRGRNVIGVQVNNVAPGPAALVARVFVKPVGGQWLSYSTDATWRTSIDNIPNWPVASYNDSRWQPAQVFGVLGKTAPWDRREGVAPEETSENQRFQISREFAVTEILSDEETGSLVNLAFNEFGHIIAAQEGGPLLLIYDSDKDGIVDKTREYCEIVDNIQGILPLNGDVYVTGDGPEGSGIYRLIDEDRNGNLEEAIKIAGFKGESGEHGPHGLTLGPDGRIYCVLGNHVQYDGEYAASSPLRNIYEGDLVTRFEDPGGHARGVKSPGGSVIRMDVEGKNVELVAGGLRNSFDLAFHPSGKLFVHDSDMESDEGSVWYRPTAIYEVQEAAEFGWRSGWAKWPDYYYDRLPPVLETGRGSPTGVCVYEHHMFPQRYHNTLFFADWTKGQVINVKLDDEGRAQSDVFIQGQPLNITDLTVGPDGWIYFCTGGRGTKGGIYQVRWRGRVPEKVKDLGTGISRAIKQPQLDAAWARQEIASLKRELGANWGDLIAGVAFSDENSARYRLRALELMQLFGPTPTPELLTALSESPNEQVRAKSATLLGMHPDSQEALGALESLLEDEEIVVRIAACESLLRCNRSPNYEALVPLLSESDRRVTWAARRLLENIPADEWKDSLLTHPRQRTRLQAGLALVVAEPTKANGEEVVQMIEAMLSSFVSDRNFVDLLRLTQVALHRTGLDQADVPALKAALVSEFPVGEPLLNRELFRILAYLNTTEVTDDAIAYLQSDAELGDRLHIAMHLSLMEQEWTAAQRYALVKFFEEVAPASTGSSVPLYVMNVTRELCKDLPLEEARIFVSEGAKWPNAALVSLYRYPDKLSEADLSTLRKLDQEIDTEEYQGEQYTRLRTGIVAMLSQAGDANSMAYLREIWIRSPERRQAVALGLSQQPSDENWDYLVRSLPHLESFAVTEVIGTLLRIPAATDDPQALREVILHGLKMEQVGEKPSLPIKLLKYWTGFEPETMEGEASQMLAWQQWYDRKFPSLPSAKLPTLEQSSPWTIDMLGDYFASTDGRRGDAEHGAEVFKSTKCADCHRMGSIGTSIGPDLSNLPGRFTRREALESILYPSHVISDQYQTSRVLTTDGQVFVGVVSENTDGTITVRDSDLIDHVVAEQDIEQMEPSKVSLMPSGLIDEVTSADIRDLMSYLGFVPEAKIASEPKGKPAVR